MDFDKSIMDDFITESREHLETIEEDLMSLEEQADNPDSELVNKLFRAAHTVKGGAGFLGLTNINKLAHSMENLLSKIRDGEIAPTTEYVDVLLEASDDLRSMIDNAEESNDVDITEIVATLKQLVDGEEGSVLAETMKEAKQEEQPELVDNSGKSVDLSPELLKSVPKDYNNFFIIDFDLIALEQEGKKPGAMISSLASLGYIVSGSLKVDAPSLEAMSATPSTKYEVILASQRTKEQLFEELKEMHADISEIKNTKTEIQQEKKQEIKQETKEKTQTQSKPKETKTQKKATTKKISKTSHSSGPAQTIRLKVEIVDQLMTLAGELVLTRNRALLLTEKYKDPALNATIQQLDSLTTELQETVMQTRMQPVGNVFNKFPRVVRDIAKKLNKEIELIINGADTELDKTLVENLSDPMTHLIRNSCDHGIEVPEERLAAGKEKSGKIWLNAYHESGNINIEIKDDGHGIDPERISQKALEKGLITQEELDGMSDKEKISLITLPGFSTAEQVSEISGRGVGMDVVKTSIQKMGGSFTLESTLGVGTDITLRLPLTLAIVPSFIVGDGDEKFAVPQINVEEIVSVKTDPDPFEFGGEWELFRLRDSLLPIVRLSEILNINKIFTAEKRKELIEQRQEWKKTVKNATILVLKINRMKLGLVVDQILGTEEIVVKPMHPVLKSIAIYSGVTIMGDGTIAMILNVEGLGRHVGLNFYSNKEEEELQKKKESGENTETILIFNTGGEEQFALTLASLNRIEKVDVENEEKIGSNEFLPIDGETHKILRLDEFMSVSSDREDKFFLILKNSNTPMGIPAKELVDTIETTMDLDKNSYKNPYVAGTKLLDNKITIFLDVDKFKNEVEGVSNE